MATVEQRPSTGRPLDTMRVVVTGGAGFVGGNLAVGLATQHPDWEVIAFDNLHRRGSELNLRRLVEAGVRFVHGDVRSPADLAATGAIEALVECSAEPSVLAGVGTAPGYAVETNLFGAYCCLEHCRRHQAQLVFLSTSRVYPVGHLRSLRLDESDTRFAPAADQILPGASARGIAESFPLDGFRTLYGGTKLAAELLVEEYRVAYGIPAVVDRFGVIAGPWQMGRVDQGFVAHWILAHHFGLPLQYLGFAGSGKQVRDVLHVADAVELIDLQLCDPGRWDGVIVNVGGGIERSTSLVELTALCRELTGRTTRIAASGDDQRAGDVPLYASDCARLEGLTAWRPRRAVRTIVDDVVRWVRDNEDELGRLIAE
jgi:CDP-paratose 2-epimerase